MASAQRIRNVACIMPRYTGEGHQEVHTFSELSLRYAFYYYVLRTQYQQYVLLQTDRSKMRLVPEAVLSENDFIQGIPDIYILNRKSPINVYMGFPIKILGTIAPVPAVPVFIAFFIHIGSKQGPALTSSQCRVGRPCSDLFVSNPYRKLHSD